MGLSPEFLWFAPLIALTAYTVFGLTGFGSTVIAVPSPVGILGVGLGNRLHHRLTNASILRPLYGLLALSGVSLLRIVSAQG